MTFKKIVSQFKSGKINCEQALEELTKIGYAPNLLNDDNGHWAVSGDGFQNLPEGDEPEDISTTIFVEAKSWKDSIKEALLYWMEKD
ncbi:MAG: hypothetical protein WC389_16005 [Lutibacter sp.]|jgi:hypothetical protein